MTKILLISPPIFDFYFTSARKEPLGLLYIKMALEKLDGISAEIYDATLSGKAKKIPRPDCFDYLKHIYSEDISSFSLFSNYYRFGDSFKKIVTKINSGDYDIVAISALFSGYVPDVEDLIHYTKAETDTIVVIGGWAVNAEKEVLFVQSKADFFLCGSGEETFPLFVKAYTENTPFEKIPGIILRKNGHVCSTVEQSNSAVTNSYPRRFGNYFFNKRRIAKVVISRGCLYKCEFCSIHKNHKFSLRSIESIEDELKYLLDAGIAIVDFEDDNLFCTKEFSKQFIPLLQKYHKKGLCYTAMNGITAGNIVPYVNDLINAGFLELNLSLVTAHENLSQSIHRPFSIEVIKKIVTQVNGRVPTLVFVIIGLPNSTPRIVLNDIFKLAKLPVTIGVSPLYLVPNVPMFQKMGLPADRRHLRGSALYKFGDSFSREQVASLWKITRMINRIKHSGDFSSIEDQENLFYFHKSLQENSWYRKTKSKKWEKSFAFSLPFPDHYEVCLDTGEIKTFTVCNSIKN